MAKTDSVLSRTMKEKGLQAVEDMIFDAFKRTGNLVEAAKELGMSQGTLGYFMRICGLKVITTRALVKSEDIFYPLEEDTETQINSNQIRTTP